MKTVEVENVSVCFNLGNQKIDTIKDYFIQKVKNRLQVQKFFALKNVSFSLNRGEALGIVGLNGSGKSTLLKAVAGVIDPYEGRVRTTGMIAPMIELGAGFDADLTARENVFLNGAVLGYPREYMKSKLEQIIDFAELSNFMEIPVKNFSSGMTARLGFAIATVNQPDILILDEVMAVGDYKFQKKSLARTEEIIANGATVLFVSHSAEQVASFCKRAIWLDGGRVVMDGDIGTVMDAYGGN